MSAPRKTAKPRKARPFEFVLYISGATEHSRLALMNLRTLADRHLKGRYNLAVVDLYQEPRRATHHDVVALPMLVRTLPLPMRRIVGDLSNENRVLNGLDLLANELAV
jgi:circadian clock protein KaiB